MDFTGTAFNVLVLIFTASTLLTVGLGTTGDVLRGTITNVPLTLGALAANLIVIPALGWGLAEALALDVPAFIALVLPAVAAIVIVELLVQLPWNLWLGRRREALH